MVKLTMSDLIDRQYVIDALELGLENDYVDATELLAYVKQLPSVESEQKGKCTKINCPIQMNYISNDCDIKTCPYRTEYKNGKWKNVALFTRECSECGAQFHELEYDNFCPNCGVKMEWNE